MARHVTIVVTVLALSGFQTALSACVALCVDALPASTALHHGTPVAEPEIAASAAAHHAHHSPADPSDAPAVSARPRDGSVPRMQALCGTCCPDAQVTAVAGPRVERTAVALMAVTPTTVPWGWPARVGRMALPVGPPVSPPSPVGALTPLRI